MTKGRNNQYLIALILWNATFLGLSVNCYPVEEKIGSVLNQVGVASFWIFVDLTFQ